MKPVVLVTGANGFVGRAVCLRLLNAGYDVRALVRKGANCRELAPQVKRCEFAGIHDHSALLAALEGVQTVVHLAARVHQMKEQAKDPLTAYRETNSDWTLTLAQTLVRLGGRKFIFVSSIKALGEGGQIYSEASTPHPTDPYGISKLDAEVMLELLTKASRLEVTVLRPPLMYGPGVKANFLALFKGVSRGLVFPLGGVGNRRSLLYVENMAAAIQFFIEHTQAHSAYNLYHIADETPVSTDELLVQIGQALQKPARIIWFGRFWPLWRWFLLACAQLLNKRPAVERLLGSLELDTTKLKAVPGWKMPYTMQEGLKATALWFNERGTPQ